MRVEVQLPHGMFAVLDCSTCHITKEDDELLSNGMPGVIGCKYEEGYFVYVTAIEEYEHREYLIKKGYSLAFVELVERAYRLGAKYLCLDADGLDHDDLPRFNW